MKQLLKSFKCAINGVMVLSRSERNFKIHLFVFLVVVVFGFLFHINDYEWMLVLLCSALVLGMEGMNTAIEKLCDFVQPKQDPAIKLVKDLSSGAVLIVSIFAAVIGGMIFFPKIWTFVGF
jgi:diacylglycerol kinase (ATP)